MCRDDMRPLTFESLLRDPLIRMVMDSDGVSVDDVVEVLEVARAAVVAREHRAVREAARPRV
ncbi:MAG: hypothetical protein KGJ41_02325 [Rhodospirillales bacterium]|nr:hypothetical protein [Rhodospirillales bacterium]MDE2197832.1 hypothetical protein [Rhodospirillales bacterium]MDE2576036.1 hypothetical protein [Rhodospirillales bacterium]